MVISFPTVCQSLVCVPCVLNFEHSLFSRTWSWLLVFSSMDENTLKERTSKISPYPIKLAQKLKERKVNSSFAFILTCVVVVVVKVTLVLRAVCLAYHMYHTLNSLQWFLNAIRWFNHRKVRFNLHRRIIYVVLSTSGTHGSYLRVLFHRITHVSM